MDKQKLQKSRKLDKPNRRNWLEYITDESDKLVVPIGSPFQAVVPDWPNPSGKKCSTGRSDARWLGTEVWPNRRRCQDPNSNEIGKGRPHTCHCPSPGSVECVKRHVSDKRVQLRHHLSTAFKKWKFDEMGEEYSKSWSAEEQKMFESVVRTYASLGKESFLELALERFPSRSRADIVKYYFNVYVLRRLSAQTRVGYRVADSTDDDEKDDDVAGVTAEAPRSRSTPQKRSKPGNCDLRNGKDAQSKYLKVRRR